MLHATPTELEILSSNHWIGFTIMIVFCNLIVWKCIRYWYFQTMHIRKDAENPLLNPSSWFK